MEDQKTRGKEGGRDKFRRTASKEPQEFEQKIVDLARVTRVMAGGKRMRFRACVALGDKKGRVGFGLAKGADVTIAVTKAVNKAKKDLIQIPIINETIPHQIVFKKGAALILLKPAPKGTGIKAGGAMRIVLELAGVPNVVGKILGTNNKVSNVKALIEALTSFKTRPVKRSAVARIEKTVEKTPIKKETK
ncbi:MAG: 30S ribosomal protein S5 [Parcubacteria group bacterium GW2011_GWC2_39_14]|nr:MAG: 30S ribosomal protein S5 [Parcubacteria group bacterium GW2011_GWC2_39_14]KKR55486.1 MAG: 30S ribosomal protein S5 [Parcubacteria group bacterium GW2011_GWA2_40_23]